MVPTVSKSNPRFFEVIGCMELTSLVLVRCNSPLDWATFVGCFSKLICLISIFALFLDFHGRFHEVSTRSFHSGSMDLEGFGAKK